MTEISNKYNQKYLNNSMEITDVQLSAKNTIVQCSAALKAVVLNFRLVIIKVFLQCRRLNMYTNDWNSHYILTIFFFQSGLWKSQI